VAYLLHTAAALSPRKEPSVSGFSGRFAEDDNLITAGDRTTFFGLPALSLSNILSALSRFPVNYRIGNLGRNVVKAFVINFSPLFNVRTAFYINVFVFVRVCVQDIETFDLEDFKYNFVNMTAFRIVDAEDVGVREILKDMEKFQPVGHSILNKSHIIQVGFCYSYWITCYAHILL
jgi:hypothetical protein